MQAFPKPEGQLFPGVAILLLAVVALAPFWSRGGRAGSRTGQTRRGWKQWASLALGILAALHAAAFVAVLAARRLTVDFGAIELRASDATQLLLRGALLAAVGLALHPAARARLREVTWPQGAWLVAALAAMWLSLGPSPTSMGRPLDLAAPYGVLYAFVPGFDGVRVPARFWMVGLLALSVLGGIGAARLSRTRRGLALLGLAWVLCLAEARIDPFVVNGAGPVPGFNAPEPRLRGRAEAPAVYAAVARQPPGAVLAELPLGLPDFDLRAMYYSTFHWRKLLNGYSGFTPAHYGRLVAALGRTSASADEAWAALETSGASTVLIHETAYPDDGGPRLTAGLRARGARELFRGGGDVLLTLR
jgi:hypothetical protein